MKRNKNLLVLSAAAALLAASCDKRDQNYAYPPQDTQSFATVAQNNGLGVFSRAVTVAGMDTTFNYLGQFTVFAPTDSAFNANGISNTSLGAVPRATLQTILRQHILSGRTTSFSFNPGPNALYTNINRDSLWLSIYNIGGTNYSFVNGRRILRTDITAVNGVIHTIEGPLVPPAGPVVTTLTPMSNMSFFLAAVQRANLTATLNNAGARFTIFAPTNAAFQAAGFADIAAINAADPTTLANILRLHVVPASQLTATRGIAFTPDLRMRTTPLATLATGTLTLAPAGFSATVKGNGNATPANIVTGNVQIRSGVVHIIDRVLLP